MRRLVGMLPWFLMLIEYWTLWQEIESQQRQDENQAFVFVLLDFPFPRLLS